MASIKAKRLLDVLRSAAADLDESHPDTASACWDLINALIDLGCEPSYFPDQEIAILDLTTVN